MDARLKTICALLESPETLKQTAAAVVLGALKPKDAAVIRALGRALPGANQVLASAILDAFEAIGSREAIPHLMPLLDSDDLSLKVRALGIMSRSGAAVLPLIKPLLADASPQQTLIFVDLLARVPTAESMRLLLGMLRTGDAALATEIPEAVHRYAGDYPAAARGALFKLLPPALKAAESDGDERALAACLVLAGALGAGGARAVLQRYAGPSHPVRIRVAALRGLAGPKWTAAAARSVAGAVVPYLKDEESEVVRAALQVIEHLPAQTLTAAQWRAMLKSRGPAVRQAAVARLAAADTAPNNTMLLEVLREGEGSVQEAAAAALAHHPKAAPLVARALLDAKAPGAAWQLAKIVKPHAPALDAALRKRVAERARAGVADPDGPGGACLYVLRHSDPAAADKLLQEAARKAMRAEDWSAAVDAFRRAMQSAPVDDATRYALSVCNLKLSPKALAPSLRADDHALRGFQALLRAPGFKLLERLSKDKQLKADDLSYVGFHFSEQPGEAHAFGEALLRHVATTWPRSAAGKAARTKLGDKVRRKKK